MGLFSFIGKAVKAVTHAIPFVGTAVDVLDTISGLSHKSPMGTTATKVNVMGRMPVSILRARTPTINPISKASVLRSSPVMPGGGVASPQGIMAPGGGLPPAQYGAKRLTASKRKRRKRSSSRRHSTRKRSSGKRKSRLKFGSPAYRKKYLGHR